MAEAILTKLITSNGLPWTVTAAGTRTADRSPLPEFVSTVLKENDLVAPATYSRQLTADAIREADLILTAAAEQRHAVVSSDVTALRRAFTIRQFARLAELVIVDSDKPEMFGSALVDGAMLARSRAQPGLGHADDIADPMGGKIRAFRACFDSLDEALSRIVAPVSKPYRTGKIYQEPAIDPDGL